MVLRIYGISSLIFIAIAIIYAVFEYEVFKRPRQTTKKLFSIILKILIVYEVLFTIYLIFMIIYGITNGDSFKKICFLIPACSFIVFEFFLLLEERFEVFDFIFNKLSCLSILGQFLVFCYASIMELGQIQRKFLSKRCISKQ